MDRVIFEEMSLRQFLRLPETKPALEYIDGEVVRKVAAQRAHSVLQLVLGARLLTEVDATGLGMAYSELRCTYGGRSLVHDLCVITSGRIPRDARGELVNNVMLAPDLAVEIISPGQTIRELAGRLSWSVRNGVRLAWLIQPRKRLVYVFRPGRPVETLGEEGELLGDDVIPNFRLPLDEMFGWLGKG
jgi:Uma2 family endonuclease